MNSPVRSPVESAVQDLRVLMRSALSERTVEAFETLEQKVNRLESQLREWQQAQLADRVQSALGVLNRGGALAGEDVEMIRSLIVGDARDYLRQENNVDDWLAELQRLDGQMRELATRAGDAASLGALRGVIKDASRLLPGLRAYFEDKDRMERFDRALANLDDANRELLVQVLREMHASPTR